MKNVDKRRFYTVSELISKLSEYNPNAEVIILSDDKSHSYDIAYDGADCDDNVDNKKTCYYVYLDTSNNRSDNVER